MPSDVRRFLRTAVPFTAILIALYGALHVAAGAFAPRFEDKVVRFEKLKERGPRVEALFVGNSLCCCADFDALGMPGYELRHPGSDLFEAAYVVRRALPHLPNLRAVMIPMGYMALHWDNSLRPEMRAELYTTYEVFEPIGGRRDGMVTGFFGQTVRPDHFEEVFDRLRGEVEYVRGPQILDEQSRLAVERHLEMCAVVDAEHPNVAADATAELEALAVHLAEEGIELFLLIPTFYHSYGEYLRDEPRGVELIDELTATMQELEEKHSNVHFLDASRHPVISRAPANFRSCDHLSRRGARNFSADLRGAIERLLQADR